MTPIPLGSSYRSGSSPLGSDALLDRILVIGRGKFAASITYLQVAEARLFFELWNERGAPDHCEKLDGQWACE